MKNGKYKLNRDIHCDCIKSGGGNIFRDGESVEVVNLTCIKTTHRRRDDFYIIKDKDLNPFKKI